MKSFVIYDMDSADLYNFFSDKEDREAVVEYFTKGPLLSELFLGGADSYAGRDLISKLQHSEGTLEEELQEWDFKLLITEIEG